MRSPRRCISASSAASGGIAIVIDVAGEKLLEANVSTLADDGVIAAIGMLGSDFSRSKIGQSPARIIPINVGNRDEHEAMLALSARHGN